MRAWDGERELGNKGTRGRRQETSVGGPVWGLWGGETGMGGVQLSLASYLIGRDLETAVIKPVPNFKLLIDVYKTLS